jgi:hypothetical protein
MSESRKQMSERDANQVLKLAFNDVDKSLTTAGFVVGKLGHKIEKINVSATIEDYNYYDDAELLYTVRVTYTDSSKSDLSSVERIA